MKIGIKCNTFIELAGRSWGSWFGKTRGQAVVCSALFLLTLELFFLLLESFIRIFTHFSSPIALLSRCSAYCCVLLLRFSKNEYDYDYDRVPQCRSAAVPQCQDLLSCAPFYLVFQVCWFFFSSPSPFPHSITSFSTEHFISISFLPFFWQYFITLSLSPFIYFHTFHINYIFFFSILLNCCYCNFTGKQEFSFSRSPFASRDVFPSSTQKKYCQFDCRSVFLTPVCFYIVFSFTFSIFFFII